MSFASVIESLFPGARITSTLRTPAQNAAVGGATNSHHLDGSAVDFVPSGGMASLSKSQIRSALQGAGLKIVELLGPGDKGHSDHFHVALSDPSGVAAKTAAQGLGASRDFLKNYLGDYAGNLFSDAAEGVGNAMQAPANALSATLQPWIIRGAFGIVGILLVAAAIFAVSKGGK